MFLGVESRKKLIFSVWLLFLLWPFGASTALKSKRVILVQCKMICRAGEQVCALRLRDSYAVAPSLKCDTMFSNIRSKTGVESSSLALLNCIS